MREIRHMLNSELCSIYLVGVSSPFVGCCYQFWVRKVSMFSLPASPVPWSFTSSRKRFY